MFCTCGRPLHPSYENDGVCEDCFAERAEKFHLPGSHSLYYGGPAKEEDSDDYKQTDIFPRKKAGQDRRRARRRLRNVVPHPVRG